MGRPTSLRPWEEIPKGWNKLSSLSYSQNTGLSHLHPAGLLHLARLTGISRPESHLPLHSVTEFRVLPAVPSKSKPPHLCHLPPPWHLSVKTPFSLLQKQNKTKTRVSTCLPKEPLLIEAAGKEDRGLRERHEEVADGEVDNEHVCRCLQASAPVRSEEGRACFPLPPELWGPALTLRYSCMHMHTHADTLNVRGHTNMLCMQYNPTHIKRPWLGLLGHRRVSQSSRCHLD